MAKVRKTRKKRVKKQKLVKSQHNDGLQVLPLPDEGERRKYRLFLFIFCVVVFPALYWLTSLVAPMEKSRAAQTEVGYD